MASSKRKHIYQPPRHTNPEVLSRKLEKLSEDIEHHKNLIKAINRANDLHVEHLSNFVRHDMKNALQGLDGTVYNAYKDNAICEDLYNQLSTCVNLLRSSLDNFSKLIPSSTHQSTTLPDILTTVETLSRGGLLQNHIEAKYEYDRRSETPIHQPFQTLVQVAHNMILNAAKSLESNEDKRILVKGTVKGSICEIRIYDSGNPIPDDIKNRMYEYGFSTTDGSGIGLFHARTVLKEMNGDVNFFQSDIDEFTKYFLITFNINNNE